jgi:hypothetical protein
MSINAAIVSDHALYPYEKCIEQLLEAQGVAVRDHTLDGWVSMLEARQ